MGGQSYFKVGPRFWRDRMVRAWDDDTRLAALYLLTCEHRTVEGLFTLPLAYASHDLEWDVDRVTASFDRMARDGFIMWDAPVSVVLIMNALRWQPPANPNVVKHAIAQLADLPETELVYEFVRLADRYSPRLAQALQEALLR